jgi:hypothetical protein
LYNAGLITRNEGRRIVALEPTEDGDTYKTQSTPPQAGMIGGQSSDQYQLEKASA